MKKGYYIHFDGTKSSGVAKKIAMQIREMKKYFDIEELEIKCIERKLLERIDGLLPMKSITRDYAGALSKIKDPDFVYIRRTVADKAYYLFLETIKTKYPFCRIIVEIFTYPYSRDEFMKWNAWPFYFKELIWRPHLREVIDRFVTYSNMKEIYGVPCINTLNGVDTECIHAADTAKTDDLIRMTAVANFQRSHGYERVIEGLRNYRNEQGTQVILYLVGSGKEEKKYRELVRRWKLEDCVFLCGEKMGESLEKIYNQTDVALGCFGLYKVGIYSISSLKISEYLAKGLPIVGGCEESALIGVPYYLEFPNDKTAVDIRQVVAFIQQIYSAGRNETRWKIREYAKETVDMRVVLLPVVEYINRAES